jgi:hypothetical protein
MKTLFLWSLPSWANKYRFLFLQILCFDFIVTIRRWRSVSSMWLCFHISNGNPTCMVLDLNLTAANITRALASKMPIDLKEKKT